MKYNLNHIGLKIYGDRNIVTNKINNAAIVNILNEIEIKPEISSNANIFKINNIEFTIGPKIGSGKYGNIFTATDKNNSTKYILKQQCYNADKMEGTRYNEERKKANNIGLTNIIREAIIQFVLFRTNPEICPEIYGIAWNHTHCYILMKLLENGTTVHNKYRGQETTDSYINDMCDILKKVATSLNSLSEIKFVHGDLHLNNIYLMDDGQIKLIDFGFSRIFNIDLEQFHNKNYRKSKDLIYLGRCISWFIKKNTEYYESDKSKNILKIIKKIVGEENMYYTNSNIRDILNNLDMYDTYEYPTTNRYPDKVLEILGDCNSEHVEMRGGRAVVAHPEVTLFRSNKSGTKNKSNARNNTRKNTRNNSWLNPMIESLKKIYNPENEIHEYRNKFTIPALTTLLQKSYVPHIQTNAKIIATKYLNEKNAQLALDFFKIMLFYNNDNFDMLISNYNKQKSLLDKQLYLYGTDPSLRGDNFMHIHWNTIPNIFVENLDIKTHLKDLSQQDPQEDSQ